MKTETVRIEVKYVINGICDNNTIIQKIKIPAEYKTNFIAESIFKNKLILDELEQEYNTNKKEQIL